MYTPPDRHVTFSPITMPTLSSQEHPVEYIPKLGINNDEQSFLQKTDDSICKASDHVDCNYDCKKKGYADGGEYIHMRYRDDLGVEKKINDYKYQDPVINEMTSLDSKEVPTWDTLLSSTLVIFWCIIIIILVNLWLFWSD